MSRSPWPRSGSPVAQFPDESVDYVSAGRYRLARAYSDYHYDDFDYVQRFIGEVRRRLGHLGRWRAAAARRPGVPAAAPGDRSGAVYVRVDSRLFRARLPS